MILIEDTRNQIGKHKELNEQLERLGIKVIRTKLFVGDYSRLDNQTICVDTKKDWLEVAGNLTKQHERFRAECLRAKNNGIKLTILVEEDLPADRWESPRKRNGEVLSGVKGEVLQKIINTMQNKYDVNFIYCDKKETAKRLLEILGGTYEDKNSRGNDI